MSTQKKLSKKNDFVRKMVDWWKKKWKQKKGCPTKKGQKKSQ